MYFTAILFWLLLAPVVIFICIYISSFNYLIKLRNDVSAAYSNIDVQLKKRYDLIPNLVSTVREYMKYEEKTLNQLISLRTKAISQLTQSGERLALDKEISQTLGSLILSVENYPELKANNNFLQLQETLNEVELNISASRRSFNSYTRNYNTIIESFPYFLVAKNLNLQKVKYFETLIEEKKVPNIDELFSKN
tara:strand:+ start:616 stop:1197 length:582 start_codon:yes stop_codon:yes gene_type:complete